MDETQYRLVFKYRADFPAMYLREAIAREKCSFFEHCSKGLCPPPPLLFEHLSYFEGGVFYDMSYFAGGVFL